MEEPIYQQMTLWGDIYEKKLIKKPIRVIEFFAGIGSQYKSLKILAKYNLNIKVESWKICEWSIPSILGYHAIHKGAIKQLHKNSSFLIEELLRLGVSSDGSVPCSRKQLERMKTDKLNMIYSAIKGTNNLVNIMNVKGEDLEVIDTDNYEYICTWSFPCQDISNAGLQKGLAVSQKDGGTRSGLCHEFIRIIEECDKKPQILLMENVPGLVGTKFIEDFKLLQKKLEEIGYQNYVQILNAKDYGIPQNRKRVFMLSILGNYSYDFPRPIKLKYRLKDFLERNVPEKYYLSEKMISCFTSDGTGNYPRKESFLQNINRENQDVGNAITTRAGGRPTDNFVKEDGQKIVDKLRNERIIKTIEKNDVKDEGKKI